ncbi:MAG: GrpB family protein, partial [Clostridia bacterium]
MKEVDGKMSAMSEMGNKNIAQERQAKIYPIVLSEYNPAWPEWFAEEKKNLERFIGTENIVRILHVGSTAVPGLLAKPTV